MTTPAKQVKGVLNEKIIYLKHCPGVFLLVWLFWAKLFNKGTQYKKLLRIENQQSLAKQLTSLNGICLTNIGFAWRAYCGIHVVWNLYEVCTLSGTTSLCKGHPRYEFATRYQANLPSSSTRMSQPQLITLRSYQVLSCARSQCLRLSWKRPSHSSAWVRLEPRKEDRCQESRIRSKDERCRPTWRLQLSRHPESSFAHGNVWQRSEVSEGKKCQQDSKFQVFNKDGGDVNLSLLQLVS